VQLGEFIKLLQEAGIPLHYEVIIAGRSEPRLVEPPPHAERVKEIICIDGLRTVFTDKPSRKPRGGGEMPTFVGQPIPAPAPAEEWNDDEDYDDDDDDLVDDLIDDFDDNEEDAP
jgi:hypothetical protein